jgi:hypothetical protein
MNTKQIGDVSQAVIVAELIKLGKTVLTPYGDKNRYDLVVDNDGTFIRIQCKTGRLGKDKSFVRFDSCSSTMHRTNGKKQNYRGQIELFAVYCRELNQVYFVPIDDATSYETRLRLTPPINKQQKGVRWANDYLKFIPM